MSISDFGSLRARTDDERRFLENPNKAPFISPQLQLLTVSTLPRPQSDFWSTLANARQPTVRNGGIFRGPFLNGTVSKAAVTSHYNAQDQTLEVVARVHMVTGDGAMIYAIDHGTWRGSNGAIERLVSGKAAAVSEYYFIGLLKYSTLDPRYYWLEEGDYLSHGQNNGDELKISQFRVMSSLSLAQWKVRFSTVCENA
jgi:Protein of unknown function (DUF3237)